MQVAIVKTGTALRSTNLKILLVIALFVVAYFLPVGDQVPASRPLNGLYESVALLHDYARNHVLLCLVPAFLIAGAMSVFLSKESVIKYFGAGAALWLAYSVASVSGAILAVCSCTVLPLFAGIYARGAGIGPASTFLYAGPAINVLAIILTARILGVELGFARGFGAIVLGLIVGLLMGAIFGRQNDKSDGNPEEEGTLDETGAQRSNPGRRLWQDILFFGSMVGILVFANWAKSGEAGGLWIMIYQIKWLVTLGFVGLLAYSIIFWFDKEELRAWMKSTWFFVWTILPLLLIGVLVAGFFLGRPGHEAVIPSSWVASLVGGNSAWSNLFASVVGALMYFATLTEVPILQGLIGSGMGRGPALALLLAGPALSLPSMIIIAKIIGIKKMAVFVSLVVAFSALAGLVYGNL